MARSVGCPVGGGYPAPTSGPCEGTVCLQLDGPELQKGRTLAIFDIPTHPGSGEFGLVSGRTGDALTPRTLALCSWSSLDWMQVVVREKLEVSSTGFDL